MEKVKQVIIYITGVTVMVTIIIGSLILIDSMRERDWLKIPKKETRPIEEPLGLVRMPDEIIEGIHFGERGENYCLVYKVAESVLLDGDWVDGEYMNMTTSTTNFNNKFIVGYYQILYDSRVLKEAYEERLKSFILYVTPIDGEEIQTREIDMLKVFEELPYLPFSIGQVVERNGKNYVELRVEPRIGDEGGKRVLFDLEEEIVIVDKSMLFRDSVKSTYISEIGEYGIIAYIDIQTKGSLFFYYPAEELLQSRLAKKYPEIRELLESIERKEGERILVEFYFEKIDDPDEIIRLFEKEGVDPFENAELKERDTKDGKRHKINSFEDFLEWYDFSESQKEEVEMLLGERQ